MNKYLARGGGVFNREFEAYYSVNLAVSSAFTASPHFLNDSGGLADTNGRVFKECLMQSWCTRKSIVYLLPFSVSDNLKAAYTSMGNIFVPALWTR